MYSNSRIQCFKACRRLFELKYIYNLASTKPVGSLETGKSYHSKVEQILKTGDFEMDEDIKTNAMAEVFRRRAKNWFDGVEIEPEVTIVKEIPGTSAKMQGRLDGLAKQSKVVIEHKTTNGEIDGQYLQALQYDEQILTYLWLSGCKSMLYTVCQKPTIRQKKGETEEEFLERCMEWYSENDSRIMVNAIERTEAEINDFEKSLAAMVNEIEGTKHYYKNPSHCNKWGRMCEYFPVCHDYDPKMTYIGFEKAIREGEGNNEAHRTD